MKKYDIVHLAAIAVSDDLHEYDSEVAGLYHIEVEEGVSPEQACSAALDCFHESVAVKNLDDFEFYVIDPETGKVLDQSEADGYESGHLAGKCYCDSTETPVIFEVAFPSGTAIVAGWDIAKVAEKARLILSAPKTETAVVKTVRNR